MAIAITLYSERCSPTSTTCWGLLTKSDESEFRGILGHKQSVWVGIGVISVGTIANLTLLVVGILGAISTLTLSSAACFTMLGVGTALVLLDLSSIIHLCLKKHTYSS